MLSACGAGDNGMTFLKEQWNLEMALEILKNKTIDSRTWSEAAKWILLYGPPELQGIMRQASSVATNSSFPQLKSEQYTETGDPCYDIGKIAEVLGVTRQEVFEKIAEMEHEQGIQHLFDGSETSKVQ
jgi:hypothetical protein